MNFILDVYIFIFFGKSCYSEMSTHLHGTDTLYIDGMKTFSVDIVVLLVISREFRPNIQQRQEILREYKILF